MAIHPRVQKAIRAMRQLAVDSAHPHPEFLLPFARLRNRMRADESIPTAAIDASGTIMLGPTTDALSLAQTAGRVCHELMHLMMGHHQRRGDRDPSRWNIAGDMLINSGLKATGLEHPETWIFLPMEYDGERTTEAVYAWLEKEESEGRTHGQEKCDGGNGCGCGVQPTPPNSPPPEDGEELNWKQLARDAVAVGRANAVASGRGTGSSNPILDLLSPPPPRQNWQRVLRYGVERAVSGAVRDQRSYARLSRRPMVGLTRPGMVSTACTVAVIVDCSGSVAREWLAQVAAECAKIVQTVPGVGIYMATHTDRLTWSGWIRKGETTAKLAEALAFTGCTNAEEAYADVAKAGKFDVVIHFTDGDLGEWPAATFAKRLVVGLLGNYDVTEQIPVGALVIPIAS